MKKVIVLMVASIAGAGVYLHMTGHTHSMTAAPAYAQRSTAPVKTNPLRDAYYGDLHLHTSYSLDAYFMGTGVGPDKAYRFAKGEVVDYLGQSAQRREPLDFMAVTDHSECMGMFKRLEENPKAAAETDFGEALETSPLPPAGSNDRTRQEAVQRLRKTPLVGNIFRNWPSDKNVLSDNLKAESASTWQREIVFANRHYEPGKFTTFIAYEWTSSPNQANLHRNVIFKGDSAPNPFTSFDSKKPEDLWTWLEHIREQGYEALAIPHNPNASDGLMYDWVDSEGRGIDRTYAEHRQANEPLSEISQNKGTSETHPLLSPSDEFANYEIFDFIARGRGRESPPQGSYLRDALSRGLILQNKTGVNPFKYGFVGASDLHGGLSVGAQADYAGNVAKVNLGGGKPTRARAAGLLSGADTTHTRSLKLASGNLTGVWAESNTRESIYSALRRRETFATTGTRIKMRFFGAWGFSKQLLKEKDWISTAYRKGVPMGGDLPAKPDVAKTPSFVIWAVKAPDSGNLDRVQVIKVWEEDGQQKEKVFDVVWSGQRRPRRDTGKLPPVGNTVDLKTGKYTNSIGAVELKTVWTDPEFNPRHLAAYYVRVLEIPTPRWSTLLAVQHGLPLPKDAPATVQLRGWSSPIWYTPPDR